MGSSRLLRLFCIALVGGLLAGALVTVLLRWRHSTTAPSRSAEASTEAQPEGRSRRSPAIVLMETLS
jgi:hypothetical protein